MPYIVITAQVEDAAKWEEGFRTHGALFREQTISKPIHFAHTGKNEVMCLFCPDDLDTYVRILDSNDTAEAMKFDGVKRDTVRTFILDKEFDPS